MAKGTVERKQILTNLACIIVGLYSQGTYIEKYGISFQWSLSGAHANLVPDAGALTLDEQISPTSLILKL